MNKSIISFLLVLFNTIVIGQFDFENQINKNEYTNEIVDSTYGITIYEPLNIYLNSDSSRIEQGYAINGWKEDHYKEGQILHKGYYIDGQLKVYKNFFPNGNIERSFKAIDTFRSKATLYFSSGSIKSKVSYSNDFAMEWIDYYKNGNISYHEKFNRDKVSHELKVEYFENGNKKEELLINNKKKKVYDFIEYFENGVVKTKGQLKFDTGIFDYSKYGNWIQFDQNGETLKKEHY
jgi:antitoxin component YwqK of YwqJK toxin-antitoxin module